MNADDRTPPRVRPQPRVGAGRRWAARCALLAVAAALLIPLMFAGLHSLVLLGVGLIGLGVIAAGLWWALTHRGAARIAGTVVAALALLGVVIAYIAARFFWVTALSAALLLLAGVAARAALRGANLRMPEHDVAPARHPFVIMNPRSGGGKVGEFGLAEKAEMLGAGSRYWRVPSRLTSSNWLEPRWPMGPTCSVWPAATEPKHWSPASLPNTAYRFS